MLIEERPSAVVVCSCSLISYTDQVRGVVSQRVVGCSCTWISDMEKGVEDAGVGVVIGSSYWVSNDDERWNRWE